MHIDPTILKVLLVAAGVALIDWVFGVLVAVRQGNFQWSVVDKKLADVALKVGGLTLLAVLQGLVNNTDFGPTWAEVGGGGFAAAAAAFGATNLADIGSKVGDLFGSKPAEPTPAK